MKKNTLSITALTVLLAMGSLTGISAADDVTKAETPVEFELQKGSVVDPEITDPEIVDPHPEVDTDFRIWYIPAKFEFVAGKLSAVEESYDLVPNAKPTVEAKIAVADIRDERSGWNLGATLSDITNSNTNKALVGATISWDQVINEIADPSNINALSESDATGLSKLTVGKETVSVMKAEANKGFGYTNATLSNIKFNVPAKSGEVGAYTGNVHWTLSQTPSITE